MKPASRRHQKAAARPRLPLSAKVEPTTDSGHLKVNTDTRAGQKSVAATTKHDVRPSDRDDHDLDPDDDQHDIQDVGDVDSEPEPEVVRKGRRRTKRPSTCPGPRSTRMRTSDYNSG